MFRQNVLHDFIIAVCIHPDISGVFKAPVQTGIRYTFPFAAGSHPVNDSVGFIIEPFTFVDMLISRIFAQYKAESPKYLSLLVRADKAMTVFYLLTDE